VTTSTTGPLEGIRVLDLSRVLAGPSCTQLLADLGADVVKVERPGIGDETRAWGPPFLKGADGEETTESGYYLSANRNKRSVTINLAEPEGAALIRRMLPSVDVLIENFKVGGLHTVPYQVFPSSDGYYILGANNDHQFRRYCEFAGMPDLADDPQYSTNSARVANRDELIRIVSEISRKQTTKYWLDGLERMGLPCGPVNTLDQVFADPQVLHRGMKIMMSRSPAEGGTCPLIGNPLKLSETPVTYRMPPPRLGEHTDDVLEEVLGLDAEERAALRERGVI